MKIVIMILAILGVVLVNEILGAVLGFKLGYVLVAVLAVSLGKAASSKFANKDSSQPPQQDAVTNSGKVSSTQNSYSSYSSSTYSQTPDNQFKPCPHCGASVHTGAKFCNACGKEVNSRNWKKILLISAGILAAAAVVFTLTNGDSQSSGSSKSSKPVDISSQKQQDPYEGWKTYQIDGVSIQVPVQKFEDPAATDYSFFGSWEDGSLSIMGPYNNSLEEMMQVNKGIFVSEDDMTYTFTNIIQEDDYSYFAITSNYLSSDYSSRFYYGLWEKDGKSMYVDYTTFGHHDDTTFLKIMEGIHLN